MAYRERAAALNVSALVGLASSVPLAVLAVEPGVPLPGALAFGLGSLLSLALVGFAAWRDTVLFCKHAFIASLFVLAGCGLAYALSNDGEEPLVATTVAGFVTVALPMASWMFERRSAPPVLLTRSQVGPVLEFEGIHLAFPGSWSVVGGRTREVSLLLENGWSGPRDVSVELIPEEGPPGAPLQVVRRLETHLEAAEVRRADFTVLAPPGAAGTYTLRAHVTVRGKRGRRVLAARAQEFENQVSTERQALHLLAGGFIWGGGLRVRLTAEPGGLLDAEPWQERVTWSRVATRPEARQSARTAA
jgi:hypothetical protein